MDRENEQQQVVETLPEVEEISDEAVARAKAMIGMRLRTEQYVRDASLGALLNFVNGIGDTNPVFRDQEYAAYTKYGSVIGHPCAPYMRHWSGRTRWGLPGVHGFFAVNDWEFFRVVRPGDAVNCVERVLDVVRAVTDIERRARLVRRHALAPEFRVTDPVAVAESVVCLHSTEPASVHLAVAARSEGVSAADVDASLYDYRSLVKQLAMRRTLFAFPRDLLPAVWGSAAARVAETERKKIGKDVVVGGGWIE